MNRIKYVDAIKGLAIILVVIGHVSNGYLGSGDTGMFYSVTHNIATAFHMPLFFAVTGFLFAHAYTKDGKIQAERVRNQIQNLVFLYFVYSILLWAFKMLFSSFVNTHLSVKNLLLMPVKPFDLYWFIYIAAIYNFIFSRKAISKLSEKVVLPALLVLSILSYRIPDTWLFGAKNLMYFMVYFYFGYVIYKHRTILNRKELVLGLLPVLILLFVIGWNSDAPLSRVRFVNIAIGGGWNAVRICSILPV